MTETETTYVTVNDGTRLFVKIFGGMQSTKPLLIAIHGGPGLSNHSESEFIFGFLSTRYKVLVYDVRGNGFSDSSKPWTHKRWVDDIEELRIWAKGEKFTLAGSSYGGFIALEYALAYPDNLSTMLLCSTFAWGLGGLMNAFKNILTSDRIKADSDRQLRLWTGSTHGNDDLETATGEIRQILRPADISRSSSSFGGPSRPAIPELNYEVHNFAFSENLPRFDVRSRLCHIAVPTLILVGKFDPLVSIRSAESMVEAMRSAQLAVFDHSGHSPPMDEPGTFRARVWEFLDGIK